MIAEGVMQLAVSTEALISKLAARQKKALQRDTGKGMFCFGMSSSP